MHLGLKVNVQAQKRRGALVAIGIVLLVMAFFLPALVNRQPILYPDSVGYFHSGYAALKQARSALQFHKSYKARSHPALAAQRSDGITTARSVYYGLFYALSYWAGNVWMLPALQVLLAAACLLLAARRTIGLQRVSGFAAVLAIVLFTGLNVFAVTVMPDLFAGLMLLAVAMILAYAPRLSRAEYVFWLAVVVVSCLFHKAHLAILVLLLLAAGGVALIRRERLRDLVLLGAAALFALLCHSSVDLVVRGVTGNWPISTPFVLARLVGDGTAERYLTQACPQRHFSTCDFLGRMPMTENDFLWSHDPKKSVMGTASRQTREAIAAESNQIVWGNLRSYPVAEAEAAVSNIWHQFWDVGVNEFALAPTDNMAPIPLLHPILAAYAASAIAQGQMPLAAISFLMRAIYFASLFGLAVAMAWRTPKSGGDSPVFRFATLLLAGIVANAIVSGAISGVFDRYQGRVAWLAPLALLALTAKAWPRSATKGRDCSR